MLYRRCHFLVVLFLLSIQPSMMNGDYGSVESWVIHNILVLISKFVNILIEIALLSSAISGLVWVSVVLLDHGTFFLVAETIFILFIVSVCRASN